MLTRLRIKNFKSLADTGDMDIRPLTFLVGPNSAGKSSLLQVLLMLRQTVDERDPNITLKVNDSWVKLGSYLECVHRAAGEEPGSRELEVDFTFLDYKVHLGSGKQKRHYDYPVDFNVRFDYDGKVLLQQANYKGDEGTFEIKRTGTQEYQAHGDVNVKPRKFYDCSLLPNQPEDLDSIFEEIFDDTIRIYAGAIEDFFSQVFYLGPLRHPPASSYEASGEAPQDVGLSGERTIDVLIASDKKQKDDPLAQVRHWLDVFDIASDAQLIAYTPTLYEFRLTDKRTGVDVNYPHVGFGASQIVPIIVEGFYSPDHALLLVEQPEIHLHPRAQARLGDLLVDISQASKTLIVETHSEHLLSQVQVRIAQGDLKREDVAIYYFEPTPTGTHVMPIEINQLGQFVNWPPGFFDQGLKLADAHLQAITQAQGRGDGRD
jgi:predicted ATPase